MWRYVIRGVTETSEMRNKNACTAHVPIMIPVNSEFLSTTMSIFDELSMYTETYCDC